MKIRCRTFDQREDGELVYIGERAVSLEEYLASGFVKNWQDVEQVSKLVQEYTKLIKHSTELVMVKAEHADIRNIIEARLVNPMIIEHQPQRAIPFQKSPEEVRMSREGRWHD